MGNPASIVTVYGTLSLPSQPAQLRQRRATTRYVSTNLADDQ